MLRLRQRFELCFCSGNAAVQDVYKRQVVTTAAAFVAVVFSIVVIQIDNLGFIAVLGDGQTVVAITVAVHIKGVAAAVGGTDFAAVPTNGSAGNVAVKADTAINIQNKLQTMIDEI